VRKSFKTSHSVCHINSLMRLSISASLGGSLTYKAKREKEQEDEK